MPLFDLDRPALESYLPDVCEPADFDAFWADTLAEARTFDLGLRVTKVDSGLSLVDVFDVEFAGFGGHPIKAWLTRPAGREEGAGPLPAVVEYNGYGGGRGLPHERLGWAAAGYVSLFMDTRGQGSRWGSGGQTPDPVGSGPATPGFMTRGILDPADHYYRRVFTDAVRAVDLSDREPYTEITTYLSVHREHAATAFRTLSYLDGVSFARRATAPALFSVALMDPICPPSTVYAAYNHYGERAGGVVRSIEVYEFNEHEGGGGHQFARQLPWLAALANGVAAVGDTGDTGDTGQGARL